MEREWEEITRLRQDLTLWAVGHQPLTLREVSKRIVALDNLLQQVDPTPTPTT